VRIFKSSLQSARLNFINIAQLDTRILNFKKATQMKKVYIALFIAVAFSLCIQSISGFKGIKISMSNDAQDIRLKSSPKLSEDQNTQMQNLADFLRFSDKGRENYYGISFFSDIATTWDLYEKLADIDELDFGRNANFMTVSPIRVDEVTQVPPEICLLSNLKLSETFSYVDAKIQSGANKGKQVPLVERSKFVLGVDYEPIRNLTLMSDFKYFSSSHDGNHDRVDSRTIVDLGAAYRFANGFLISAGVKNVFDEEYNYNQNLRADVYNPAPGRNYYVEFKYAY